VAIRDADGEPVEDDDPGEIAVRGRTCSPGTARTVATAPVRTAGGDRRLAYADTPARCTGGRTQELIIG